MKKLSVKTLIDFRRKTEKSKKGFVNNLKMNKEKNDSEGGGDYWISSLSALSRAFKSGDVQIVKDKIEELDGKLEDTNVKRTKGMYQRNIDILYQYEDFDFKKWKPSKKIELIKKQKDSYILKIKELEIQAIPHHVFTFKKNEVEEIGAIWFIAKLGGYTKDELGMFADILYRYLKTNFSKYYGVNSKYCIAVDVVNAFDVNYSQIEKDEVPSRLISTIDDVKRLM